MRIPSSMSIKTWCLHFNAEENVRHQLLPPDTYSLQLLFLTKKAAIKKQELQSLNKTQVD